MHVLTEQQPSVQGTTQGTNSIQSVSQPQPHLLHINTGDVVRESQPSPCFSYFKV
jgi:hypothetical protein